MRLRAWALACASALAAASVAAPHAPRAPAQGATRESNALPAGIERWTLRELDIAAARPLAERGAVFRTAWLDRYFRAQPWYRPAGFDPRRLTSGESARIAALSRYRAALTPAELAKKREELEQRRQRARVSCPLATAATGKPPSARAVVLESSGPRAWDLATGTSRAAPRTPGGGEFWAQQVALTRDGARLLAVESVNQESQVSTWEWSSLRALPAFRWIDTSARYHRPSDTYALSHDGSAALAQDLSQKTWTLARLQDSKARLALSASPMFTAATRVAKSADSSRVLAVAAGRAWLWSGPGQKRGDGTVELGAPREVARASDADLSPDGRFIAAVGDAVSPSVAPVNAPKHARPLGSSMTGGFDFVAFSPGGDRVLAGNEALGIAVWDVASGTLVYERPARAASLRCARRWASFLEDGEHLVLAGEAGGLEVVELRTGKARVVARDRALPALEDERIEDALLAQASSGSRGSSELRQLSFEEQPLLLEQPVAEAELLRDARAGLDLRSLEVLIQARRGRSFRSPRWKAYAEKQRFYRADAKYGPERLTKLDRENLALIARVRQKLDPRPPSPPPDVVSSTPVKAFPACPTGSKRADSTENGAFVARCVTERQGKHLLDGPEWIWFPTGRLAAAHAGAGGVRHGPALAWYFSGARRFSGAYERGSRDGQWLVYHRNGTLALEANFEQGAPNGSWTTFYDDGRRAIALSYRAGVPDPRVTVERFAPDGNRWPAGAKLTCGDGRCATPLERLDFESLPPLRAESCARGGSDFDKVLPRAASAPVLAAAKQAWPADAGGGDIPGPGACVDSVRLACARDLDGDATPELLAEVSYRIVFGSQRGCRDAGGTESWPMSAIVALSPPAAGRTAWQAKGIVAYPRCSADTCPGSDTLAGFVLLPSGETGARVTVDSSGGDCAESEHEEIRTLQGGAWKAVGRRTTRACDGTREPEENDVY